MGDTLERSPGLACGPRSDLVFLSVLGDTDSAKYEREPTQMDLEITIRKTFTPQIHTNIWILQSHSQRPVFYTFLQGHCECFFFISDSRMIIEAGRLLSTTDTAQRRKVWLC